MLVFLELEHKRETFDVSSEFNRHGDKKLVNLLNEGLCFTETNSNRIQYFKSKADFKITNLNWTYEWKWLGIKLELLYPPASSKNITPPTCYYYAADVLSICCKRASNGFPLKSFEPPTDNLQTYKSIHKCKIEKCFPLIIFHNFFTKKFFFVISLTVDIIY